MSPEELATPITESQLGVLLNVVSTSIEKRGSDWLRRLAFERDKLKSQVATPFKWTSEPPKVPGWYWVKYPYEGETIETIVEVNDITSMRNDVIWAGPIPQPVESE